MKKKVLLKSVAAVMSALTLAPCFGDIAFAMKKNEGQVVMQQAENEKEIAKNEIIKLVETFVSQGKATNKKELEKFRKKINENKLSLMLSRDNNANTRALIYSVILAYLIEKNYFHFEINLEAILNKKFVCCANGVRDLFVMLDTTLRIYFSDDSSVLSSLASLRVDLFKIDGCLQKRNYSENKSNTLKKLLSEEKRNIELFNESLNDNDQKDVQNIFDKIVSFYGGDTNVSKTYLYLFGLFQNGVGSAEFCKLMEEEICDRRSNSKLADSELKQRKNVELQELKEQLLAKALKQQKPKIEARNKEQEQKREEEKEKSRNTKKNESMGVIEPNYSEPGMLLKDEKEKEEEASKKAEGRKQAKEIEINQQKEKEKEKEKETQARQEEIEKQHEKQTLPSDCLGENEEEINKVLNEIFTEKSKGVQIKPNNYTKIFTAVKDGSVNNVYFPFYLLNSKISKKYRGKSNFVKDLKRKVYDISRLTSDKFKDLSIIHCSQDTTIQQFLSKNFNENAKKCFVESGVNLKNVNVYKFTPVGSLNNKDRIAFVKSGNVIIVLDFLGHIDGGEKK